MRFWKGNQLCDTETFGSCSLTSSNIFCQPFLVLNCSRLKVTAYLQGCLACKRCSASGLNCRYLNPYQIKAYKTQWLSDYTKNFEKNELSNFSLLLNASARITFWTLHVKTNFVFRLFMCSSIFRAKALKKCVCDLPCIQFQWKVTDWTFSK